MSNKTLVLYLEDEHLKSLIQSEAMAQHLSVSKYVSGILQENLKTKQPKNKLLKRAGALKHISIKDWQQIDQSMQEFRKSFEVNLSEKA